MSVLLNSRVIVAIIHTAVDINQLLRSFLPPHHSWLQPIPLTISLLSYLPAAVVIFVDLLPRPALWIVQLIWKNVELHRPPFPNLNVFTLSASRESGFKMNYLNLGWYPTSPSDALYRMKNNNQSVPHTDTLGLFHKASLPNKPNFFS